MEHTLSAAETLDWQHALAAQVAQIGVTPDTTHLIVHRPDGDEPPQLLDLADSQAAGVISAEDFATKVAGGEVVVVPFAQIKPLLEAVRPADAADAIADTEEHVEPLPTGETELEIEAEEEPLVASSQIDLEPDPDTGQLLKMPRIAVTVDEADPGVIKLAFSGSIELDRAKPDDVAFYNRLAAGRDADLNVTAFCAGPKNSHRRDSEGNVDAVVQTKSLIIHSLTTDA